MERRELTIHLPCKQPTLIWISLLDEETRLPKFCLWTFEENGVEYLTFNSYGNHVLFYEIATGRLVKKVKYETEGNHGVGFIV